MPETYNGKPIDDPRGPKPFAQAVKLQRVAFELATDPGTQRKDVAALMRAWDVLEERKRVLRMRPKPRDIDVTPRRSRKQLDYGSWPGPACAPSVASDAPPAAAAPPPEAQS